MVGRATKVLAGLGFFSLFILILGLGAFVHYQNYHPLAFVAAYGTLIGLPFLWILPHSDVSQFRIENGILIGFGTAILMGLFHIVHSLSDGDPESFLLVFPMAAFFEVIATGSFLVRKGKGCQQADRE